MEKDDIEDQTDQLLADPEPIQKADCDTVTDVLELDQIEQEYEMDEEAGASITPQLAKVVTTIAKAKLSEGKLKAKLEKKTQAARKSRTCSGSRSEPRIWGIMDHTVKAADLKLQRTQQTPLKSAYVLARVCDVCVASQNSETKGLLRVITDAIGLTLKTIRDISLDRRANILNAPNMNQKYR